MAIEGGGPLAVDVQGYGGMWRFPTAAPVMRLAPGASSGSSDAVTIEECGCRLAAAQVVRAHPAELLEGLEAAACPDLVVAVVGATRPVLGMPLEPASSQRCYLAMENRLRR